MNAKTRLVLFTISVFFSVIFLFVSFKYNFWNAAKPDFFAEFQGTTSSEAFIINRLKISQESGIFSRNGLMTIGYSEDPYFSQLGGQAMFLGMIQKFTGWTNYMRLQSLVAIFNAVTFAGVVFWFGRHTSYKAAFFTMIVLGLSAWPVGIGRNLYWIFGTMMLPMLLAAYLSFLEIQRKEVLWHRLLCMLVAVSVFIKCSAGYEYISAVLWASLVPLFFYFMAGYRKLRPTVMRMIHVGSAGLAGFFICLATHFFVLKNYTGNTAQAYAILKHVVTARTFKEDASSRVPVGISMTNDVLKKYMALTAIETQNIFFPYAAFFIINFTGVAWMSIVATTLVFADRQFFPAVFYQRKRLFAMFATSWFALVGPLSWIYIARGHSYHHEHLNSILWYIGFLPLMTCSVSYIMLLAFNDVKNKVLNRRIS